MTTIKETLYIYSMGKRFKVGAMFPDTPEGTDACNAYCARHGEQAVIAVAGGQVFTADKYPAPNTAREDLAERMGVGPSLTLPRLDEATDLLRDCWNQFAYEGGTELDGKWSGGLSTLEAIRDFLAPPPETPDHA
ncbi:MAG: hypothetical protein AABY46_06800 [Nitrospirota bacterium]